MTIHFDFNRSEITPQAAASLDSIAQAGQVRQIILTGHCDFIGSDKYNDSLSQARILAVKEYLGGKGLSPAVFKNETAFGERKPMAAGHSDESRAINRRVELTIQYALASPPTADSNPSNLSRVIRDSAVKTGTNIVLENLNFVGGRHQLLPESFPILDDFLRALQQNPGVKIEIQGYVCCTYDHLDGFDFDVGTNDLSVQRAKAIYNYLIEKGIDSTRLSYRGFGAARKLFPNEENEYERSRNRRVELKILNK